MISSTQRADARLEVECPRGVSVSPQRKGFATSLLITATAETQEEAVQMINDFAAAISQEAGR